MPCLSERPRGEDGDDGATDGVSGGCWGLGGAVGRASSNFRIADDSGEIGKRYSVVYSSHRKGRNCLKLATEQRAHWIASRFQFSRAVLRDANRLKTNDIKSQESLERDLVYEINTNSMEM